MRARSHSDELDRLCAVLRQGDRQSAAEREQRRAETRREVEHIHAQLTRLPGWEALGAVRMKPADPQQRRWAHEAAEALGLVTCSEAEGTARHVVVRRRGRHADTAGSLPEDAAEDQESGVAGRLRRVFEDGALCWGRCVDYCCPRRNGRSLLMECARAGATEALTALLTPPAEGLGSSALPEGCRPAAVNGQSAEGHSALHYASYSGHAAAVHALLQAGADGTARNARGEMAEGSANAGGHAHVAQVLAAWAEATRTELEEGEVEEGCGAALASGKGARDATATGADGAAASWGEQKEPAQFLMVESPAAKGVAPGAIVALPSGAAEMTVGRSRSCGLALRDLEVSSLHAALVR